MKKFLDSLYIQTVNDIFCCLFQPQEVASPSSHSDNEAAPDVHEEVQSAQLPVTQLRSPSCGSSPAGVLIIRPPFYDFLG